MENYMLKKISTNKKNYIYLQASIFDSLKQVVPWRRRKEAQRKWVSLTDTV